MSLEHTFSAHPFDASQTVQVRPQEIHVVQDGSRHVIPYADIVHVRLAAKGQGTWPTVAELEFVTNQDDRFLIRSAHCTGLLTFEDRQTSFDQVSQVIVERVALENPEAEFMLGSSWHSWIFWCFCLLLSVAVLSIAPIAWHLGQVSVFGLGSLALIAAATPWAWRIARDGSPREFHPLALPQGVLPG